MLVGPATTVLKWRFGSRPLQLTVVTTKCVSNVNTSCRVRGKTAGPRRVEPGQSDRKPDRPLHTKTASNPDVAGSPTRGNISVNPECRAGFITTKHPQWQKI